MGYLKNFEYEVFLSYAHKDNETVNEKEEGWMTQFYKQFKLLMDQYLEDTNTATIWCDFELRKNMAFNDEIKEALNKTAIFLAFTSNSFYRSEYCCEKELSFFYDNALKSSFGLKIENNNRLFQIQLLNKPHSSWPKEFQGVGCYQMFKYLRDDKQDQGIRLNIKLDEEKYQTNIVEIVQDVCSTLKLIKEKEVPSSEQATRNSSKVFFGKVSDTLLTLRDQVAKELEANNISAYKCLFPPPYEKEEHKKIVTEKIEQSQLSVHLFNEIGGDKIDLDYPYSFLQEQALLSMNLKKKQLIFIPQQMDIDSINDAHQKKFLSELLTNKSADSNYTLIKEFSVPLIIEHINTALCPPIPPPSENYILLDFNNVDRKYAVEYYASIANEKNVVLTPPSINPIDFINSFDKALLSVKTIIIVWYDAAKEWFEQRIRDITCAIKTGKSKISEVYIYKDAQLSDLDIKTLLLTI